MGVGRSFTERAAVKGSIPRALQTVNETKNSQDRPSRARVGGDFAVFSACKGALGSDGKKMAMISWESNSLRPVEIGMPK
jgi:hypothetical protein